jgi:hypothetical protein
MALPQAADRLKPRSPTHGRFALARGAPAAFAVFALVHALACGQEKRNSTSAPRHASEEAQPFSGVVARSEVIRGGHRFAAGPQGVWFELQGDSDTRYFYYAAEALEQARANGVLRTGADGVERYHDLAGRYVDGEAKSHRGARRGRVVSWVRVRPPSEDP